MFITERFIKNFHAFLVINLRKTLFWRFWLQPVKLSFFTDGCPNTLFVMGALSVYKLKRKLFSGGSGFKPVKLSFFQMVVQTLFVMGAPKISKFFSCL